MAAAAKVFKAVSIKLEMNALEAAVIHEILRHVGGNPEAGLRGVTDNVRLALSNALAYGAAEDGDVFDRINEMCDGAVSWKNNYPAVLALESQLQYHLANN